MNIHNINDFDKAITNTVKEMEVKHNCWIWILSNNESWFMNVCYIATQEIETEVKLVKLNCNKYEMASAIRQHFKK